MLLNRKGRIASFRNTPLWGSIMVFLLFGEEEGCTHQGRHQLRTGNGPPDAVDAPDKRQQQNRCHLEHQGTQEGDQCRGQAVTEGGEEAGEENGKTCKEEGNGENPKAAYRIANLSCFVNQNGTPRSASGSFQ